MFAATTRARPWSRDPGVWAGVGVVGVIAVLDAVARVQLTGGYAVGAIVASMLTDARGVGVQMVRRQHPDLLDGLLERQRGQLQHAGITLDPGEPVVEVSISALIVSTPGRQDREPAPSCRQQVDDVEGRRVRPREILQEHSETRCRVECRQRLDDGLQQLVSRPTPDMDGVGLSDLGQQLREGTGNIGRAGGE